MTTIKRIIHFLAQYDPIALLLLLLPLSLSLTLRPIDHSAYGYSHRARPGSSPNAQIPVDTPNYATDVETWWATHPFNPESSTYIPVGNISSPGPVLNVQDQYNGNIQAAINALPSTGGTLYFDPGTYPNAFQLVGKSNVHFISAGGATLLGGPGRVVGCQEALIYSNIAAGVHSRYPDSIACVTSNRIQNIYFKNITFDGGGSALNAIDLSAAKGVVFDNVVFQNFYDPGNSPGSFHGGVVNGNVNLENIWFRGVHFAGPARWTIYLDGAHFSGVVGSRLDFNFGDINSSSGGLLFMTNDDLNGDYNQNGIFEPNEKRNANHIVVAHNFFGVAGNTPMHSAIVMNGTNILIKKNIVLRYIYRFVIFMGKCDAINPGVDMGFYNFKVFGNRIKGADIFTHVDGAKHDCSLQNNTMGVGKYVVRDNVIDAQSLPAFVWETSPPIVSPKIVEHNCVGGKFYGTNIKCDLYSSVFLPLILSGP